MHSIADLIPYRKNPETPICISTDRPDLIVRQITPADAKPFYEAVASSRDHLAGYGSKILSVYNSVEAVQAAAAPEEPVITLGMESEGRFVGGYKIIPQQLEDGRIDVKLGCWLRAGETRQGTATTATQGVAAFLHNRARTVYARVGEGNDASYRVLERSGFEQTDRFQEGPYTLRLFTLGRVSVIHEAQYNRFDGASCTAVASEPDTNGDVYVDLTPLPGSPALERPRLALDQFLHATTLDSDNLVPEYTLHG